MRSPDPSPARFVRPELAARPEYVLDLSPCRHKLDQNESPYELPRSVKETVGRILSRTDWGRYPSFHGDSLREALAKLHGWPAAGILVGNGSNELLKLALEATVAAGIAVLGCEPSFSLYRTMVLVAGGVPEFLPPRVDLRLPVEELERRIENDPGRPLILCSPNNPTGDALDPGAVAELAERLEAPLLLDNAYGEFCRFDYRPLLEDHPNLVLFRTFSKAWSLGGLRVGYLLADPRLVAALIRVKLPYNLGRAGSVAAREALKARHRVERRVELLVRRRAQWRGMLEGHGLEVFPSEANFLLVRCGETGGARQIFDGLESRGIRVRDVSSAPGLRNCLRFTVGDGAALRAVDRALVQILGRTSRREGEGEGEGAEDERNA